MAFAYVTEYARCARDASGQVIQAGDEPPLAAYQVAIGAGSVQGAVFNVKTAFIRVETDAVCSYKIATNPTAVATEGRLAANSTEFFGVDRGLVTGAGLRIAIILNT